MADLEVAERDYRKKLKEREFMAKKKNEMISERDKNTITRNTLKDDYERLCDEYDKAKRAVEELKKEIESKMRERDLLNKDVVEAEEKKVLAAHLRQTLENDQVKLKFKL